MLQHICLSASQVHVLMCRCACGNTGTSASHVLLLLLLLSYCTSCALCLGQCSPAAQLTKRYNALYPVDPLLQPLNPCGP
jgi:hypothetical protein